MARSLKSELGKIALRICATPLTIIAIPSATDIKLPIKKEKHWEHLNKGAYKSKR